MKFVFCCWLVLALCTTESKNVGRRSRAGWCGTMTKEASKRKDQDFGFTCIYWVLNIRCKNLGHFMSFLIIPFHIDKWQQKLSRHRQTSTDHWSRWIAWHMPMQTIPNSEIILACWERIERIYWRWKIMAAPFRLKQKNLEVNSHFGCVLALDAGRCPMTGTNPNRQLKIKRPVPDFEETHPSLLNFLDFCQQKKQTPCSKGTHKVAFIQQQIPCLQVQWLPWRWSLTMGPDMMRSDPINGWPGFFPSVFFYIVTSNIFGTLLKTNVVKLHGIDIVYMLHPLGWSKLAWFI